MYRSLATSWLFISSVCFAGTVSVSTPTNYAKVASPTHVVADASSSHTIKLIRVYLDGTSVFDLRNQTHLDTYLWAPNGTHHVTIKAWDSRGSFSKSFYISVQSQTSMNNIEDMGSWQWCSQTLNGSTCAAGLGEAVSWMAPYQSSPALDGSSAEWYIGGSTGYSNALWWRSIGGGNKPSHFIYDFWVYVEHPELPQSLEFDLNQSFGGKRWVFGTQCDFKDSGKWDLWDSTSGRWQPSPVPCSAFQASHWTHVVLTFERVQSQVHYVSVQLDGVTYPFNIYWGSQSYSDSDINVAFQMDGDYQQDPYNVWIDEMKVTAW